MRYWLFIGYGLVVILGNSLLLVGSLLVVC